MDTWRPSNWEELIGHRDDWVDRNSLETGADMMFEALSELKLHALMRIIDKYRIEKRM